jgi:formiminotetrahydrofolate cyclodeaminase
MYKHIFLNCQTLFERRSMSDNIAAFQRVLDPNDNSTGGGTASAIAGAMAAALVAMVARLSIGRKGSKETSFYQELISEAELFATNLFTGGRRDAEAFADVMASYRMPKDTAEQVSARRRAIDEAMLKATCVPLINAQSCRKILNLILKLEDHMNPNTASDLECAGHLARAGLLGCLANVKMNLPGLKNEFQAAQIAQQVDELGVIQ